MLAQSYIYPFESELKKFYESYKQDLEKHYPGLQLARLLREFESIEIDDHHSFINLKDQLIQGVPLEYISNRSYFYNSEFYVSTEVLIPRSETEIIVEKAVEIISKNMQIKSIVDIGCGSGAIGLTIAEQNSRPLSILLTDISDKALAVTKRNLWEHQYRFNPDHSIELLESDLLDRVEASFDLIITNPPYIKRDKNFDQVHQQVIRFEPHLALFLEDNEYNAFFEKLFHQAQRALNPNGYFLMEGHEDHLEHLATYLSTMKFYDINIIKDYTHRPRFLMAKRMS